MRPSLLFSSALLLAAAAAPALAQTMYKCVGAGGKVAYSDLPCPAQAKVAREFAVPPPETQEQSAARLAQEKARLRRSDAEFRERHLERQRSLDSGMGRIREGAYIDAPGRQSAPPSSGESEMVPARRAGSR